MSSFKLKIVGMDILNKVLKIHRNQISYMIFNVTARCNAFCDFCWNWKRVSNAGMYHEDNPEKIPNRRKELTLDEIEAFSEKLPEILLLNLCGGEPYVREDLNEIINLFVKNNKVDYFTIPSNGFMTERIIKTVERACRDNPNTFFRLGISLDGPAEVHDKTRRYPGGFNKAIETAKELNKLKKTYSNFSLGSDTVYSRDSEPYIEEFILELHKMNLFDQCDVNLVRGELMDNEIKNVDLEKFRSLNKQIMALRKRDNSHPFTAIQSALYEKTWNKVIEAKSHKERVFDCYAGSKFVTVDDRGDVHACEIMQSDDKLLGNLRDFEYDLNKVLASKKAADVIKFIEDKKCACTWDCAINMSWLYSFSNYPGLGLSALKHAL